MEFTLEFIEAFVARVGYVAPILVFLGLIISLVGLRIGRLEGWNHADSLYYAFITATTVGYGDFHPKLARSKYLAITIALTGILFTGIVVAIGINALEAAITEVHGGPSKAEL